MTGESSFDVRFYSVKNITFTHVDLIWKYHVTQGTFSIRCKRLRRSQVHHETDLLLLF